MRRFWLLLLGVVSVVVLSGCASATGSLQGHVLIGSLTSGGGTPMFRVTVELINDHHQVVAEKRITEHGLAPGTPFQFKVKPGTYRLVVQKCSRQVTVRANQVAHADIACLFTPEFSNQGA